MTQASKLVGNRKGRTVQLCEAVVSCKYRTVCHSANSKHSLSQTRHILLPAGPPVHVCAGADCCQDRAASVQKGMQLLEQVMLKPISVPALNKWTKVAPCIRHVSLLQNFCSLAPKAFKAGLPIPSNPCEASSEDEGEQVGAPVNESKVWKKLARLRLGKAAFFLEDEASRWSTIVPSTIWQRVSILSFACCQLQLLFIRYCQELVADISDEGE